MNKEKLFFVVEKGTNIVQMISQDMAFMGDENAARFKVNILNKAHPETSGFESITIAEFEEKFGGENNENKSE